MIAPVTPVLEPETPRPAGDRWRQWWLALFSVTLVLLAVIGVASRQDSSPSPAAAPVSDSAPSSPAVTSPAATAPSATPSASAPIL